MSSNNKIVVEGIECRFVKEGDTILPEDHNCKVDILIVFATMIIKIDDVVEFVGW